MFVGVRHSRQVAIGPVIFIGPIGGAAVVLLKGRGAVVLIRAGLDVAAVVLRHLQEKGGRTEIGHFSLKSLSLSLSVAATHDGVTNGLLQIKRRDVLPLSLKLQQPQNQFAGSKCGEL